MATKRFDVTRMEDGRIVLKEEYKNPCVISTDAGYTFNDRMWDRKIINNRLIITAKSKAVRKPTNTFNLEIKEGSYFFYNSSTNWYWYYRDAKTQLLLDKFYIDKITSTNNSTAVVPFYAKMDVDGNFMPTGFDLIPTVKYYGPGYISSKIHGKGVIPNYKSVIDVMTNSPGIDLYIGEIALDFMDWVIVEIRPYHRELYINKNVKLESIPFDECELDFKYPAEVKGE